MELATYIENCADLDLPPFEHPLHVSLIWSKISSLQAYYSPYSSIPDLLISREIAREKNFEDVQDPIACTLLYGTLKIINRIPFFTWWLDSVFSPEKSID